MSAPLYEIYALRYAHLAERNQGSNLIFPDDHAAPMPLDFFVWVIIATIPSFIVTALIRPDPAFGKKT